MANTKQKKDQTKTRKSDKSMKNQKGGQTSKQANDSDFYTEEIDILEIGEPDDTTEK